MADSNTPDPLNGPNTELYARLSRPFDSREEAHFAMRHFLEQVAVLREQNGIPEVCMVVQAYAKEGGKTGALIVSQSWGDPRVEAELFHTAEIATHIRQDRAERAAREAAAKAVAEATNG